MVGAEVLVIEDGLARDVEEKVLGAGDEEGMVELLSGMVGVTSIEVEVRVGEAGAEEGSGVTSIEVEVRGGGLTGGAEEGRGGGVASIGLEVRVGVLTGGAEEGGGGGVASIEVEVRVGVLAGGREEGSGSGIETVGVKPRADAMLEMAISSLTRRQMGDSTNS